MTLELKIEQNPQFSPDMPKYSGHIKICTKQGDELWRKEIFSSQEAQEFIQKYGKTVQKPDWVKATILPIRTDNLNNFAKDLFLPTFVNQTLKIHNVGLRSFASFFAIMLDVITFIPRVLLSPFKAFYDHYKKEPKHPLNNLLKKQVDQLDIQIYQEIIELKNDEEDNNIKYANKTAEKVHCWITTKVIPGVETKNNSCEKYSVGYIGNNNEWVVEVGPSQKFEASQSVNQLLQKLDLHPPQALNTQKKRANANGRGTARSS